MNSYINFITTMSLDESDLLSYLMYQEDLDPTHIMCPICNLEDIYDES